MPYKLTQILQNWKQHFKQNHFSPSIFEIIQNAKKLDNHDLLHLIEVIINNFYRVNYLLKMQIINYFITNFKYFKKTVKTT